jgi:hypothetical protein
MSGLKKDMRQIMISRKNKKWQGKTVSEEGFEGKITFIPISTDLYLIPKRANDTIPDWYKKIPAVDFLHRGAQEKDLTIKRCIPILDAFTTGYVLVTKEDLYFSHDEETGESSWSGEQLQLNYHTDGKIISSHPIAQLGDMPFSPEFLKFAFKWNNPYIVKTPPGYSCIFTNAINQPHLPFLPLTGIVDTDTYFQPVLFPFIMKNNFKGIIPKGTPVIQIIPFKRDDWEMEIVDQVPMELINSLNSESMEYESGRYYPDGKPAGGMYKRDYRKKKRYR